MPGTHRGFLVVGGELAHPPPRALSHRNMSGMPDPKAPVPTTTSAPSEQLPTLLGVQYDTQTTNQCCCTGVVYFLPSMALCRREFESVFGLTRLVWGPPHPSHRQINPYQTLCRNDIITNMPRHGVDAAYTVWYSIDAVGGRPFHANLLIAAYPITFSLSQPSR